MRKRLVMSVVAFGLVAVGSMHGGTVSAGVDDSPDPTEAPAADAERPAREFDKTVGGRIVGGVDTDISEVPWQVAITDETGFQFCGGSIVSARWIVTAAHCFADAGLDGPIWPRSRTRVWAGRSDLPSSGSHPALRPVDRLVIHPGWDEETYQNDIALLRLSQPLSFGPAIRSIELPFGAPASWPAAGTNALVSGWGALGTSEGDDPPPFPDTLQSVLVDVLAGPSDPLCGEYAATPLKYFPTEMLCAGVAGGGKDACQGDSGGPLAVKREGRWLLAGITSWGIGCAEPEFPGIYARVTTYTGWIAPTAPPRPIATTDGAPGELTVTWSPPSSTGVRPVSGYEVVGSPTGACTTSGDTSCVISGLAPGVPHTFTVRAVSEVVAGPPSAASEPVTPLAPFRPLTPTRLIDTRATGKVGAPDGNGTPYTINVNGRNGLPDTGIGALALNLTVVDTENPDIGGGYVTVYPCGTRPDASNLNFTTDQIVANSVIAPVSPNGDLCIYVYGTTIIPDISGYFPAGSAFNNLQPTRLIDTRATGKVGAPDGNGTPYTINVNGRNGLPDTGIGALALNLTVVDTENPDIGGGYVTVYPCGTRPDASNLNFTTDQIVANSVIAPVSPNGDLCIYVYGTTNIIADISGWLPR